MAVPVKEKVTRTQVAGLVILVVITGLILAGVFVVTLANELREAGVGAPDTEAVAFSQKHADTVLKLTEEVTAAAKRARAEGAAARSSLPSDALISADWDVQVELRKAWTKEESGSIEALSRCLTNLGSGVDNPFEAVRAHFESVRKARPLTHLEERLDPTSRSDAEVTEVVGDFALELSVIDEMEAAIDHGVWPMTLEVVESREGYDDRLVTGMRLLCGRAIALAKRGETHHALSACVRLSKLHATMFDDTNTNHAFTMLVLLSALEALGGARQAPACQEGLLDAVDAFVAYMPTQDEYARRMRLLSFSTSRKEHRAGLLAHLPKTHQANRFFRAYDQADAFAQLLERPALENPAKIEEIRNRFKRATREESDSLVPSAEEFRDLYTGDYLLDFESHWDTAILEGHYQWLAQAIVNRAALEIVLALDWHKAATGTYPKSLDALVPGSFAAVPIDPLSGKALIYELTGDGYRLLRPVVGDAGEPTVLWEMGR